MRIMSCLLCEVPVDPLYDDDLCYAMLHDDRAVAGHAMIVAKRHIQNVADLERDEWAHIANVWRIVERALLDETKRERSIVMKLGIQVAHLHIHLYPVRETSDRGEVFAAINGTVNEPRDAEFSDRVKERIRGLWMGQG
jgi:diadenosine tetraphosphate (Ap4A) HIT family hydrolase